MDTHTWDDFKECVRQAIDFPALVAKTVTLPRAPDGQSPVMALCPFHDDRSPSLAVYADHAYCFACGKHWDAFGWVMQRDGVDFRTALDLLAEQAGIPRPHWTAEQERVIQERQAVEQLLSLAADYYAQRLWETDQVLRYARSRGWSDEIIRAFRLGYADGRLAALLREEGADPVPARQVGLIQENGRDFLTNRLVFPFLRSGRVVYMTGRALSPNTRPKYLHLPLPEGETRPLYGADALQGDGPIVIVEGPADVLTLHQWHIPAVALLGTSLPHEHIARLQPHKTIFLALDNDDAGREATRRLAEALGPMVRWVRWPEGVHDANDYARQGATAEDLQALLNTAPTWLDVCIEDVAGQRGAEREAGVEMLFRLLASLDPLPLARYKGKVTKALEEVGARDFDRLVKAAQDERKRAQAQESEKRARVVLWDSEPHPFRQSLDYVDGKVYAVVQLYTTYAGSDSRGDASVSPPSLEPYIVTSERELLPWDKMGECGLALAGDEGPFADSRWSKEGIKRFLNEGYTVTPAHVFEEIDAILDFYIEFQETKYNDTTLPPSATRHLVALDVMKTYFLPVWGAIGYAHARGEKGSGKTTLFRVLAKLAFQGELITAGTSVAALKRQADLGYSLYFDDVENIRDRRFDPDKRAIILAGNTRGVTVPLMEPDPATGRWRLRRFRAFCHKGFNNIQGVDDVLGRRCYTILMVRSADRKRTRRDPDASTPPVPYQQVIDDCYTLAMTHMPQVAELYRQMEGADVGLDASDFSIWRPIFTLAQLIDQQRGQWSLYQEMVTLSLAKRAEKAERETEGLDVVLIRALVKLVLKEGRGSENRKLTLDDILAEAEAIDPDVASKETQTKVQGGQKVLVEEYPRRLKTKAGKVLANLDAYSRKARLGRQRAYVFVRERVERLAAAYGVNLPAGDDETCTDRVTCADRIDEEELRRYGLLF